MSFIYHVTKTEYLQNAWIKNSQAKGLRAVYEVEMVY